MKLPRRSRPDGTENAVPVFARLVALSPKTVRAVLIALVAANIVAFGYIRYAEGRPATREQFAALQISPHKMNLIKVLPEEWRATGDMKISLNLGMPPAERKEKPQPVAPPPSAVACLEWGTFGPNDMPRAMTALAQLGLNEKLGPADTGDREWWVYIPPRPNMAEADKKAGELRALGITDFQVVQHDPKFRNAISMGVFRSEEGARNYLDQLRLKRVRSAVVGPRRPGSGVFTVREGADGDWWLFIARPTKAEIDKKAGELRALGVADFFIVKDPNDSGFAISLGVYGSEEAAQKQLGRLREQKVRSAVVGPRGSKRNVVVIPEPKEAVVGKLTELRKDFPAATLAATACADAMASESRRPTTQTAARPRLPERRGAPDNAAAQSGDKK